MDAPTRGRLAPAPVGVSTRGRARIVGGPLLPSALRSWALAPVGFRSHRRCTRGLSHPWALARVCSHSDELSSHSPVQWIQDPFPTPFLTRVCGRFRTADPVRSRSVECPDHRGGAAMRCFIKLRRGLHLRIRLYCGEVDEDSFMFERKCSYGHQLGYPK